MVDFGAGLSVHHQARFKSFDFVVLAGGIFLVILDVLLGHNNPQWHSVRNADFFDFLFKILQLNEDC